MKKKHSLLRNYFEYTLFRLGLFFIWCLPPFLLYPLASFLAQMAFVFDRKHRRRVIKHLLHAGVAKNEKEAKRLGLANFKHIGKIVCDIGRSKRVISREKIFEIASTHEVREGLADRVFKYDPITGCAPQVIVASAHFGNWEIAGNMYAWLANRTLLSITRPMDNPLIGHYMLVQRQCAQHKITPKDGALKPLMKALLSGESVCLLMDQHAPRNEGLKTTFFGRPVMAHASMARLHLRTKVPVAVGGCRRCDDGHFVFEVMDIIDYEESCGDIELDLKRVTDRYLRGIEQMILMAPEQWVWAHRRFLDLRQEAYEKRLKY